MACRVAIRQPLDVVSHRMCERSKVAQLGMANNLLDERRHVWSVDLLQAKADPPPASFIGPHPWRQSNGVRLEEGHNKKLWHTESTWPRTHAAARPFGGGEGSPPASRRSGFKKDAAAEAILEAGARALGLGFRPDLEVFLRSVRLRFLLSLFSCPPTSSTLSLRSLAPFPPSSSSNAAAVCTSQSQLRNTSAQVCTSIFPPVMSDNCAALTLWS